MKLKIWKNTDIIDDYVQDLNFTEIKKEADIAALGGKTIDLAVFPNLKGIFRIGVGMENVPVSEAKRKGIRVQLPSEETKEYIYDETANFSCYLIFRMLFKNYGMIDPWVRKPRIAMKEKKLLVIGAGHIGGKVVEKMRPFIRIDTFDTLYNSLDELDEKMTEADCVTLHIPLTPETNGFLDKRRLSLMKDDAVLINTSRGPIVSEGALFDEINSGRIAAAFDVFWSKPYLGKLKSFHPERFFMTPHAGSYCESYLRLAGRDLLIFAKEMESV